MTRDQILDSVLDSGAVAVVRMADSGRLVRVAEAIAEGGVTAIEVTMTTPNALDVIESVSRQLGEAVTVGVGSVLDAETARRAVDAGARYVVSPVFKREIISEAHRLGVPAMPGCFTPTEIQEATEAGADVVKVFPADVLGIPFFKGVLAPMPHLRMMPTGGVSLTNAGRLAPRRGRRRRRRERPPRQRGHRHGRLASAHRARPDAPPVGRVRPPPARLPP